MCFHLWGLLCSFADRKGLDSSNVPVYSTHLSEIVGQVLFNFAFITTVPSWVNEKKPSVSIHRTMWIATFGSTIIYVLLGWFGALAYKIGSFVLRVCASRLCFAFVLRSVSLDPHGDLLSTMNAASPFILTRIAVYVFPLVIMGSSIPIYCIIVKYNLVENNICRPCKQLSASPLCGFIQSLIRKGLRIYSLSCCRGSSRFHSTQAATC